MGDSTIDNILKENEDIKDNPIYKSLINVRVSNFLNVKIINEILKIKSYKLIEKNMKMVKIYLKIFIIFIKLQI